LPKREPALACTPPAGATGTTMRHIGLAGQRAAAVAVLDEVAEVDDVAVDDSVLVDAEESVAEDEASETDA